jgi:hypothetical protein
MARALPARMFPQRILDSSRSFVAYCCACACFASPIVSRSGSFPRMPSALVSACQRGTSPDDSHPLVLPVLSGWAGCALLSPACSLWLRPLSASPRLVKPSLCPLRLAAPLLRTRSFWCPVVARWDARTMMGRPEDDAGVKKSSRSSKACLTFFSCNIQ